MTNFKSAPATFKKPHEGASKKGSTKGREGYFSGDPEKKEADQPKFIRHNERSEADGQFERNAKNNRNLWKDPDPDVPENRARQQVVGGSTGLEDNDAGLRVNEDEHSGSPGVHHYGDSKPDLIQGYQDIIIDKHAKDGSIFEHKKGSKEAYQLAKESKVHSTRSKRN